MMSWSAAGIDVLLDDRGERPGVMFADLELIGIPTASRWVTGLKEGMVEYQAPRAEAASKMAVGDIVKPMSRRSRLSGPILVLLPRGWREPSTTMTIVTTTSLARVQPLVVRMLRVRSIRCSPYCLRGTRAAQAWEKLRQRATSMASASLDRAAARLIGNPDAGVAGRNVSPAGVAHEGQRTATRVSGHRAILRPAAPASTRNWCWR